MLWPAPVRPPTDAPAGPGASTMPALNRSGGPRRPPLSPPNGRSRPNGNLAQPAWISCLRHPAVVAGFLLLRTLLLFLSPPLLSGQAFLGRGGDTLPMRLLPVSLLRQANFDLD